LVVSHLASLVLIFELLTGSPSLALFHRRSVIRAVSTSERVVALTFDDGPHPLYTPQVLRILAGAGIRATFFMIGRRMEQYPALARQVAARGHVIGNHTYSHPRGLTGLSRDRITRELAQCEPFIQRSTGLPTALFRPPLGWIDSRVMTLTEARGYRTILWTVCADHHDAPEPKDMAARVLRYAQPGAIILLHDGEFPARWKDVAALPLIIAGLRRRGYRFATVPELLALDPRNQDAVGLPGAGASAAPLTIW
jgi:peptidoglycan/xylan/chitin deacetylase (PgdA/CDA1 family)